MLLYLTLQELELKESKRFQKQNFLKIRDTCRYILSLIGEVEVRES